MPENWSKLSFTVLQESNIMNTLIRLFGIFAALSLVSGCVGRPINSEQQEQPASKKIVYQSVLNKPVTDTAVIDFITTNHCSSVDHFQFCKEVGIALWVDPNQVVETVYLYVNAEDDVQPYKGDLPYGLKFYDTQSAVEYRLKKQGVGNAGLPDEGSSPDHLHYWATYKQAGLTIIYNSPYADEDATINTILISK